VRTVAADGLWMSPMYERDTVCVHFTWKLDPAGVARAVRLVEEALSPFEPRPHWGKVFSIDAATVAQQYERLPDFLHLVDRLDPRGVFRNSWFEEHVGGG
jgi:xylitol oxidase